MSSATTARAPKASKGSISELLAQNNIPNTVEQQIEALGTPRTDNIAFDGKIDQVKIWQN